MPEATGIRLSCLGHYLITLIEWVLPLVETSKRHGKRGRHLFLADFRYGAVAKQFVRNNGTETPLNLAVKSHFQRRFFRYKLFLSAVCFHMLPT